MINFIYENIPSNDLIAVVDTYHNAWWDDNTWPANSYTGSLSGQHYNQCDKATSKDQAGEKREERERERREKEVWLNGSKRSHQ